MANTYTITNLKRIVSSIMLLWAISLTFPARANALSIAYCGENTDECKYQNCVTALTLNNWPEPVGDTKDCDQYLPSPGKQVFNTFAPAIAVTGIAAASVLIIRHKKKSGKSTSTPRNKKQ